MSTRTPYHILSHSICHDERLNSLGKESCQETSFTCRLPSIDGLPMPVMYKHCTTTTNTIDKSNSKPVGEQVMLGVLHGQLSHLYSIEKLNSGYHYWDITKPTALYDRCCSKDLRSMCSRPIWLTWYYCDQLVDTNYTIMRRAPASRIPQGHEKPERSIIRDVITQSLYERLHRLLGYLFVVP